MYSATDEPLCICLVSGGLAPLTDLDVNGNVCSCAEHIWGVQTLEQQAGSVPEECNLKQMGSLERGNGSVLSWVEAAEHALPAVHDEMAHTRLL